VTQAAWVPAVTHASYPSGSVGLTCDDSDMIWSFDQS
jgi:hypothetical protein